MANLASAQNCAALRAELPRFLVAWPRLSDLLLWAKYLLVGAMVTVLLVPGVKHEQCPEL
jgi:hypothetical protein